MTIHEAAEHADVNYITIWRWIRDGKIKAKQHRRTRSWAIDKDALDWFLENGPPKERYPNPKREN